MITVKDANARHFVGRTIVKADFKKVQTNAGKRNAICQLVLDNGRRIYFVTAEMPDTYAHGYAVIGRTAIDPAVLQDEPTKAAACQSPLDEYDTRNGAPFDRGGADAYYGRPYEPHYFKGATYSSPKVTKLTKKQLAAYKAGYERQTEQKDGVRCGDSQ